MSKGTIAAGLAAIGAVGLGLYIFKDNIISAVKGATGASKIPAPAATGLDAYRYNVSNPPAGGTYIEILVKPLSVGTVLNPGEFPDNAGAWIDNEFIGNLNAADYAAANPGYHLGRAIKVPDRLLGTGKHTLTFQIPSVTYGLPAHYPEITYPGGVQKFLIYL